MKLSGVFLLVLTVSTFVVAVVLYRGLSGLSIIFRRTFKSGKREKSWTVKIENNRLLRGILKRLAVLSCVFFRLRIIFNTFSSLTEVEREIELIRSFLFVSRSSSFLSPDRSRELSRPPPCLVVAEPLLRVREVFQERPSSKRHKY